MRLDPGTRPDQALPPQQPSLIAQHVNSVGPTRRLAVGLTSTLPFLGVCAAFSTFSLSRRMGLPAALVQGMRRGLTLWAPFGSGCAIFYALEYESRALVAGWPLPAWALPSPRPLPPSQQAPAPATQFEQLFGREAGAELSESVSSRSLAGTGAALIVTSALAIARRRGFRTLGSVLGVSVGCGLAAPFMPAWRDVERRFPA